MTSTKSCQGVEPVGYISTVFTAAGVKPVGYISTVFTYPIPLAPLRAAGLAARTPAAACGAAGTVAPHPAGPLARCGARCTNPRGRLRRRGHRGTSSRDRGGSCSEPRSAQGGQRDGVPWCPAAPPVVSSAFVLALWVLASVRAWCRLRCSRARGELFCPATPSVVSSSCLVTKCAGPRLTHESADIVRARTSSSSKASSLIRVQPHHHRRGRAAQQLPPRARRSTSRTRRCCEHHATTRCTRTKGGNQPALNLARLGRTTDCALLARLRPHQAPNERERARRLRGSRPPLRQRSRLLLHPRA